jgi:hypothetical protein
VPTSNASTFAVIAPASIEELWQRLVDDYRQVRGVEGVWKATVGVLVSFARQHGRERVVEWMRTTQARLGPVSEKRFTKYISGIRRRWLAEQVT